LPIALSQYIIQPIYPPPAFLLVAPYDRGWKRSDGLHGLLHAIDTHALGSRRFRPAERRLQSVRGIHSVE
jgi:hypothetical protein